MSVSKKNVEMYITNVDYLVNAFEKIADLKAIIQSLNSIDLNVFKGYKLHGIEHAINVSILALILSSNFDITQREKKILIDAALLHDIGRVDDYNDYNHCKIGAILASNILEIQSFYKESNNINLVMLLIEGHNNIYDTTLFKKYGVIKDERVVFLQKILMDSDILDRVRFGTLIGFDINRLNLSFSKELIDLAFSLNECSVAYEILKECDYIDRISKDSI